jgi:hypothetical protein
MGNKRMVYRINETKSWLFKKINRIDKPVATLAKRKIQTQINKIKMKEGNCNKYH